MDITTLHIVAGGDIGDTDRPLNTALHPGHTWLVGLKQHELTDIPGEVVWSASPGGLGEGVFHEALVKRVSAFGIVRHLDLAGQDNLIGPTAVEYEVMTLSIAFAVLLHAGIRVGQVLAALQDGRHPPGYLCDEGSLIYWHGCLSPLLRRQLASGRLQIPSKAYVSELNRPTCGTRYLYRHNIL